MVALVGVLSALVPPSAEAAKTDVVVLFNGDRITGEVKELLLGRLRYSTDDLGTIYIEWDKIAALTAVGDFEVELQSGEVLLGSMGAGPSDGEMTLTLESDTVVLALASIIRITAIKRTFWSRIDGKLDLGASYNQASEIAQFTLHSDATVKRPKFWAGYQVNSIFTRQRKSDDTARHRLALNYYYLFASRWLALTRLSFERNRELGFELRTSFEAGAGKFLIQTNRRVLIAGLGVQVNRERPVEGDAATSLAAAVVIRYWAFLFDFPHTDVEAALRVLPDLSSSGRVRLEADVRLSRELLKDFYLSLTLYESFDSKPPTRGAARNDLGATVSLGWKF